MVLIDSSVSLLPASAGLGLGLRLGLEKGCGLMGWYVPCPSIFMLYSAMHTALAMYNNTCLPNVCMYVCACVRMDG